ncbi:MAG: YybH family protein [Marmoricola sp.]
MGWISESDLDDWLNEFAECVRRRDYEAGRALFVGDATGFGTVANQYADLDDLVGEQWSEVWDRTEEFTFAEERSSWIGGSQGTVAVTWRSIGLEDGDRRERTGRATVVIHRYDDGEVLAVHSHFSMTPGTSA